MKAHAQPVVYYLSLFALLSTPLIAQNCPTQDVPEGKYVVGSAAFGDNRCLDADTSNDSRMQVTICNGGSSQVFSFSAHAQPTIFPSGTGGVLRNVRLQRSEYQDE
jgi:hypothetical protein